MKTRIDNKVAVILFIILSTLMHARCDKDPEPNLQKKTTQLLTAKEWKVKTVTVDAEDQTALFAGFRLRFTDDAYTSSSGGKVWPPMGTWTFTDQTARAFERDDQVIVTIDKVTRTELILSLFWDHTTFGGGRLSSIQGQHIFLMEN